MFLRGLNARRMLALAALALLLTASAASSNADSVLGPLPFGQATALGRPLKQPTIAVAVGLKNIIFPPCPPEVASSVKDQLGIAKFWNLWNITDNQDKTLFPVAKNESKARTAHPCTIFAVPDDSFAKQPSFYTSLEENPLAAAEFISNHIIGGPVIIHTNTTLTSVGGLSITPLQKDGGMFVNGIKVIKSDVKLPSGSYLYVIAEPLCCTSADVIPLATTLNGSVVSPISPSLGDVGSFVFDRPSISYLRKAHLLPANYTVKARHFSIGRGPSAGNGTGLTRYVYRSPASIWGAGQPSSIGVQNDSIYQVLPGLSGTTFLTLLQLADCRPSLKARDPVTLFMPTDEALASLPPRDIQALIADPERLRQTLLYHIAPGAFTSGDLSTNVSITTVEGKPLRTDTYGNTTLNVEGAKVILSDIIGHNGVIHIIDRFLYPVPNGTLRDLMEKTPNVNQFLELCKRVNLTDYLTGGDPYTVFAPTNDALTAIAKSIPSTPEGDKKLRDILLNHIVPGIVYTASWSPGQILPTAGGHTIYLQYQPNESGGFSLLPNGATVAKSDLGATNGVCHIINKVMPIEYAPAEPPQRTFWKDIWKNVLELFGKSEEPILPTTEEPPRDNIIATLKKLPNAKALLDAFNATGLIPKLETAGPITIFVPVNSAFDQLKRPISELIKTNRSIVEKILLNHIIPRQLYCEELKKLPTVKSLQGTILTISASNDGCANVDDSDILYWNITAKNGIIHLIDKILSVKDLIPEELLTTTEMEILTTTELEISTIQEILATTMGLPSTSTEPSVPEVITTEVEVTTSTEEVIILSSEGTTPVESVTITTIVPEEITTIVPGVTTAPEEVSSVVPEEMSTAVVKISTEVPTAVTAITELMTLSPEVVTSVATTEEPSTTPTSKPIDTGYFIPGEETTTGQPPTGREFPGPPTAEKPVVYLPDNVSDMITPRPMVTFTSSTPIAPSLIDLLHQLNLTTFPNLLNMTGLDETLPREGPLTIFAPTDAAFNKLDIPTLDKLFEDKAQLKRVLQYHVVSSPISGNELPRALQAVTLDGSPVFITVYIINRMPTAFINNATISPTQHNYNGTIVYLIDMVLISPPDVDLYTTISKTLKEETMTMYINKARLDPLLTGPGPVTVFVPSEAAWNKLPEDLRTKLETNETALKDYILSHIIRGAVFTPVMTDGSKFITSNGKVLTITRDNGLIKVNNAHIINPDIVAINGVIHVIDMVFPVDEMQIVEVPTMPVTEVAATTTITPITKITSEQPSTEIEITEEASEKPTTEIVIVEVTSEEVSTMGVTTGMLVTTEVPFTTIPVVTTETIIPELVTKEVTTEEVTTLLENATTVTYPMTTPGILPLIPALRDQGLTTIADLLESIFAPKILNLYGLFTLFAPTNEAFESLSPDELKNLKNDSQALQQMLLYHAINRILPYDNITDNLQIPSIQGNNLTFNVYDDGRIKTILGSNIVKPDIKVENGLVHIIDRPLYPIPRKPLLETVDKLYPSFSSAINKTNNRPNLTDKGITAFIPSEEFWAHVPQPIRETVFSNSSLMNDIVQDHVCSGRIFKVGIRDGISCTSLSGKPLTFTVKDNTYYVHAVPIILFDIISTDGIIHVINRPLFLEIPGYPKDIIGPIPSLPPTRPPPKRPGEMTTAAAISEATEITQEITTGTSEETSTIAVATELTTSAEITTELSYATERGTGTPGMTEESTVTEYTAMTKKPEILNETEATTVQLITEEMFTRTTPFREEITETIATTLVTPGEVTAKAEITTSLPDHTTVYTTESMTTRAYTTLPNATIPSILQQQFQEAGYPIEVTELKPKLPDTTLYTAFIPYSVYLSGLPIVFLQDLAKNTTAIGDIFANHICAGARYSPDFQNGFTCVSLGGNIITVTLQNGKYYCNGFPIIRVDVPALDGVVHFINGLIFFEPISTTPIQEITTIKAVTASRYPEITTVASTEEIVKTEIPTTTEIEGYTVIMNATVPAVAQVTEEMEYTTATRGPKALNITEATEPTTYANVTTLQPTTIEEETKYFSPESTEESTLAPEYYTTGVTRIPETTTYTPSTQQILNKTEPTTIEYQATEFTTGISEEYSTTGFTTKYSEAPAATAETTEAAEYTTVSARTAEILSTTVETTTLHVTVTPNKTIATNVQEEFKNAGYPIDVTDLQQMLPDTNLYTAFIPYSVYLSGLPSTLLQDIVSNKTAVTETMLNHICQDATYSPEFQDGFTCTSLGGKPLTVTNVNGQYYCNGFPIIRVDIPVIDGVIHLIDGILYFKPEAVTPPAYTTTALMETTLGEEVTTAIPEVTVYAETIPTTPYTVTTESRELNITGITEVYPETTEITKYPEALSTTSKYPEVTKAIPSTSEAPIATEYTTITTAYITEQTSPFSSTEKELSTEYPEVTEVTSRIPHITEEFTERSTVTEVPYATTVPVQYTTEPIIVKENETIPFIFEKEFDNAGYPIDVTELKDNLPDTFLYTACVPYSRYLSSLPHAILQDLTRNNMATTITLLNHICRDATHSPQLQNGYTCTTLGGKQLKLSYQNGQYYCNNFPIIGVDIPTTDGVVYFISGLLFFEPEGITAPATEITPTPAPPVTTTITIPKITTGIPETTEELASTTYGITEYSTLVPVTREPKVLNISEPMTIYPVTFAETRTTEYPEMTTSTVPEVISTTFPETTSEIIPVETTKFIVTEEATTEYPVVTSSTSTMKTSTEYQEVTSEAPETSRIPHITEEFTERSTVTEVPYATTVPVQYTTELIIVKENETIPFIFEKEFDNAGYPIDVTELKDNLPDTFLYTACVPYSRYLSSLPHAILQDLTRNNTATTITLLNHICRDATHSPQLQNGYTCTTLGGKQLKLSYQNGQYYCNNFPIIGVDIPTTDGVVYFINGLLFFEPEGITAPATEITPTAPPVSTTITIPKITTGTPETTEELASTTYGVTEYSTLVPVTREPKVLNISEPMTIYPVTFAETRTTEYPEMTTSTIPEVIFTTFPETTSEIIPVETTKFIVTEEATTEYPVVTSSTPTTKTSTEYQEVTSEAPETSRIPHITEEFTERSTVTEVPYATTVPVQYTTEPIIVKENETIPFIFEKEFDNAGYPIDVTELKDNLPDTFLYTACVPYSRYLSSLPHAILQDLTRNNTATTITLLNHICRDATHSPQLQNGYTCTTLGGKQLKLSYQNGQYYCNNFPIIGVDIPTTDGVVYFISGLLFFEPEGITAPATEITPTPAPPVTTTITIPKITTGTPETTEELASTTYGVTEYSTLVPVTREPKVLNISEPMTIYPVTFAETRTTEYPEMTISTVPEVISTTFPETTSEIIPVETTKFIVTEEATTEYPVVTSSTPTMKTSTEYQEVTSEAPEITEQATVSFEYTTTTIPVALPNVTIPSVMKEQFEKAGYPIEVNEVQEHLPDTSLYTACVPYSLYLSTLPNLVLQDITRNKTATTNALLDHICQGATYSSQVKNGYTCTSLGGKPIIFEFRNNQYYCNKFPVITVDFPTSDGVIYFINGFLFLEPEGITPPSLEMTTVYTEAPTSTSTGIIPEGTTGIPEIATEEIVTTTSGVAEYTTLKEVTREPKFLNITEPTTASAVTVEVTSTEYTVETVPSSEVPSGATPVPEGITPPSLEMTTVYTEAPSFTSPTIGIISEGTTGIPEIATEEIVTTTSGVTEYTTLKEATREPKLLNITEPTTVSAVTVEVTSTAYTVEAVPSSEVPSGATIITTEGVPIETTEYTTTGEMITEYPAVTMFTPTTKIITQPSAFTSEVPIEFTTSPASEVAPNETIPSVFQQQFDKAGYPIDVTEVHQHLPDTSLYTACIPYSFYLSTLPSLLLQDQTKNKTATTNFMLNHICKGAVHSPQLRNGYTCTSLGGKTIIFTFQNNHYYCNNFPVVKLDVPTSDGVAHFINGLLFFEHEGITTPSEPTETTTVFMETSTTEIMPIVTTGISQTTIEEILSTAEVTEYTTMVTEPMGVHIVTTELTTSTEYPEQTAETLMPSELPTATEKVTKYPEVTFETTQYTAIEEVTTAEYPTSTSAAATSEVTLVHTEETSEVPKTTEKTTSVEYTTPLITTIAPNQTIPSVIEQQFQTAGYPVDVTEVQQRLPETTLYTACLPYSTYLSTLPSSFIQDLTRNSTAISGVLLNHICEGVTYSSQLKNDYTCTSLQGKPIILSFRNNQYYCNNFPVIQVDVPASDGVIYLINGLFYFEHEGITTPATETTMPYTELSSPPTSVIPTGITELAEATTSRATTEISKEAETTPYAATEYTTLKTVTRGPKVLNISEATEIPSEITEVTPTETATSTEYTETIFITPTSAISTEVPVTFETTMTTELMTPPAIPSNETIPEIMAHQFEQTGYPVDVTDVIKQLPDTHRYTACVPDYTFLSTLSHLLLQDLAKNITATTSVLLNHICPGEIYSSQFKNGFTCISLGGKPIFLTTQYGQFYCNDIPIIKNDIPTANGIVHLINGLLFFEPPAVTSAAPETTATYLPTVPGVTTTEISKEFTTEYFEVTPKEEIANATEPTTHTYTISTTETSEPKVFNITEPTVVYPETTRILISTEYPEASTAEPITTTYPISESTTATGISYITEVASTVYPEKTENATIIPALSLTPETLQNATTEFTSTSRTYTEETEFTSATPTVIHITTIESEKTTETPEVIYRSTTASEYTISPLEIPVANKSIPNLIEQQFEQAGYPTDSTGLKPNLPETYIYLACLPHSTYLSGLPSTLLKDITMNSTAFTKVMLTHICRAQDYKPGQKTEYSCTSLGGTPIFLSYINGQHFCNDFPIISEEIPTTDGIVYYINGFFVIAPEVITSLPTEQPTTYTEISSTSSASTEFPILEMTTEAFTSMKPSSEYPVVSETSTVPPGFTTKAPPLSESTTEIPAYTRPPEVTLMGTVPSEYTTKPTLPEEYTTETEVTAPPLEITTLYPEISTQTLIPEVTIGYPETPVTEVETTAITAVTEHTTLKTVTREPKVLNVSEPATVYTSTTEEIISTQLPEISTEAVTSSEIPALTERITQYPEVTSESAPAETTEYTTSEVTTTEYPFITRVSPTAKVTTSYPEATSEVPEITRITTTIPEETTLLISPVASNDTIPSVIRQQFEQAGYPIDVTDVQDHLPDTSLYTACVPYSIYLSGLPSILLQDLIRNNTAITNALLDHICEGVVYSPQLKNGHTCKSLGGKQINLEFHKNQYYCNNFPVVKVDVPTNDGVIYFINGFLFLESQGITPPPLEITTFTEISTEISSEFTTAIPKMTTEEALTTIFESTEYTTLKTISREPKILNITEPVTLPTTTSEEILSTEYPDITTETVSSAEIPSVTEVSNYTEVTSEGVAIKTTEYTATEIVTKTEYPGETTQVTIGYPEVTTEVPETTTLTEYTTSQIPKVEPNETIPFVIKQQFEISGFPIDITDVQHHLPDTSLYTACVPYSSYLSTLPSLLLQDLARNKTATTNALLDHICPGIAYSSQLKNGYTCISLGGKPIIFTFQNHHYYCNNFPVIKVDVPTSDGVIHFINGLLFFEPEGVTPSVPEISTLSTETTRITPTVGITEVSPEATTIIPESTKTEELTTFEATEYTTVKAVTREPITVYEVSTEGTSTEYPEVTTKNVTTPVVSPVTEIITTKYPEVTSEGVPIETTAYTSSELMTEYLETTPVTTTRKIVTEYEVVTSEVTTTTENVTASPEFTPITGVTEKYTVKPEYTTVSEGITEGTFTPEYTTLVPLNETIPLIIEQEFDNAGFPVNTTSIKQNLPDSYVYTACIPYHQYLSGLPHLLLQDLTTNQTAITNVMLNHICRGTTFSSSFKDGYTCTSLGNTPIILVSRNGHHYCNNVLIIQSDIPTADGVVHIINGLFHPETLVTPTTPEISPEVSTTISTVTPIGPSLPDITTYPEYITTVTGITEETTTEFTATREPKFLNITEAEVIEGTTTEYATSAETVTTFTSEYPSTQEVVHATSTLKAEEGTTTTAYPEVTSIPSVSKATTGIPEESTVYQTEFPETTGPSMTQASHSTTLRPEIVTEEISTAAPNKTIPTILMEQFQKANQSIDVSELLPRLPDRYLYTAFLPYYYYIIHGLPSELVQDLGRNKTAVGDLFINHICPEVTYSHQFQFGYLCTSLGGPTITVTAENGRYLANGFPIIELDIPTLDGVVHLIDGLFIEGATPPPELAPGTTVTPHATTSALSTIALVSEPVTEVEGYTTESTPSVSTAFTSATSTRESKVLNISEPTEVFTEMTSTSPGITEEVTRSTEYAVTTEIPIVPTMPESNVTTTEFEATVTAIPASLPTIAYETSTSEFTPEYTETTKHPSYAITEFTTEGTTKPAEVTEISKEYTTTEIVPLAPSDTIPSTLENQFNKSGNPIDVSELRPLLPDSDLYTAFIPTYYYIMHDLPSQLVQDLTRNRTATGVIFANHICTQARYSKDFHDGFSCTSIGGLPIVITVVNGKYFANGFPIFRKDIPVIDGVVHLIDGLFVESVTPPPGIATTTSTISPYTEVPVSPIVMVSPEVTTAAPTTTEVMPLEITTSQALTSESTTIEEGYTTMINTTIPGEAQVTEKVETTMYTTLATATREPKFLNISEETTAYQITKEPEITTEESETTYSITLEVETTQPSTPSEYSTAPAFTEPPTREPTLLNETASPPEYTITEMTTQFPEITQESTVVAEIITSKYTPVVNETLSTTAYEVETSTPYLEKYTTSKEVATTEYEVTKEVQTTTVPPEYATTKYPELYNVTTAVTELTGVTEEETTPLYPEINATTTLPFFPPESRGILSVSIFFYLVDMSGVDTTLAQGGPYTILAPVDAAFHALPPSVMTQLKTDMPFLREILLYHIIPQKIVSTELQNDNLLKSLQGQGIRCNIYGPVITLGGAKIVMPDGSSGYGVLHIVNRVLYPVPVGTVLDTIQPRNDTDKVQALLRNTTLPSKLKGPGPYTIFLPSDRAINSLPSYVMDILENNATMLEEFVLNHMVSGTYYTAGMTEGLELTSLGGQILRISQAGGLTVNGVPIVSPDISVTNGVVHIIDQILFDPSQDIYIPKTQPEIRKDLNVFELTKQLNLTTFANLLVDSGLSVNLSAPGYYTVFAPTNDAFAAMPASQLDTIKSDPLRLVQILLYHILPVQIETNQMTNEMVIPSLLPTKSVRMNIYVNNRGPWYTASGSQILMPNNEASNGVVHVVHQVLYIPLGDIVQTVEKCSILQTLRHIISISGLEDQLRGGNYTLLAPNDAAFNKLPEDTLERLTLDPHLSRLFLLGHLIRGTVNTEGIFDESTLTTASNNQLYVRALKDCILLNSAAIQYPDVTADNGVVHVIDRVL